MTDQQRPPEQAGGTTAPGRAIPAQVAREQVTTPETVPETIPETIPTTVPEQAVAPVEETLAPPEETVTPVEEAVPTVEEAPTARPRRRLRRRRAPRRQSAFRRWRKTRPFWGGIFTMLGGIEIAALTAASYELLFVSRSVGFAIAVGAAIAVLGLTMWLSPVLSKLLGLLTLVAALLSFVTSNLGGFLLGMLLSIIGGGLAFAWEPGREPETAGLAVEEIPADEPGAPPQAVVPGQRAPDAVEGYEPLDEFFEG